MFAALVSANRREAGRRDANPLALHIRRTNRPVSSSAKIVSEHYSVAHIGGTRLASSAVSQLPI